MRDGIGILADIEMTVTLYELTFEEAVAVYVVREINDTSLRIGQYESLKRDALDPYTLFRDVYHQNRQDKIKD